MKAALYVVRWVAFAALVGLALAGLCFALEPDDRTVGEPDPRGAR